MTFIFVDINKQEYVEMFDVVKDKVKEGGIIAYHDAYMKKEITEAIISKARSEGWFSIIVSTVQEYSCY